MSEKYEYYLTSQEAAQVLGVSRRTLARYKSQAKIAPITVNNKDLYPPSEVARFSAKASSKLDKVKKQHAYNSSRLVDLELRVASLETLLNMRTVEKLSAKDVNFKDLYSALDTVCRKPSSEWTIAGVDDLIKDVSRLDDRLLKRLGDTVKIALELASLQAVNLKDQRSMLLACRAELLLGHVKSLLD